MNDVEHLFMCLLAICMSSLEKGLFFGLFFDWVIYFWTSLVAQMVKIHLQCERPGFDPLG